MIGLDCAPPALLFDRLLPHMPVLASLCARGMFGTLRSTVPPITMPAWACMVSGRDPGELGIYGFRTRIPGSRALRVATASDVHVPRIWDVLGAAGKRSAALYVPPTWPPRRIERGTMVSCLLTPGPHVPHTWPPALGAELASRFGPHTPDVAHVHGSDDALMDALHDAATQHFDVAEHVLTTERPDMMMMVEMGTDRLHHAMWPALDPSDPRHDPASPAVRDARDFYAFLDARIGRLIERAGRDATVMIVSDHGARPLRGGVYVNEWLRREGWLVLRSEPEAPCTLEHADVDWSRTRAWAEGGYFARVMLNLKGRFPDGAVEPDDLLSELDALEASLLDIPGADGHWLRSWVVRPDCQFRKANGTPPDLMFFLDELNLRALGEVGTGRVHAGPDEAGASRGRGADGCNHDWDGMFVLAGPEVPRAGRVGDCRIHDAGVTALELCGVDVPARWIGNDLRLRT